MDDTSNASVGPETDDFTEVLAKGGFKSVDGHRKRLREAGIQAQVICPPGVNPNG